MNQALAGLAGALLLAVLTGAGCSTLRHTDSDMLTVREMDDTSSVAVSWALQDILLGYINGGFPAGEARTLPEDGLCFVSVRCITESEMIVDPVGLLHGAEAMSEAARDGVEITEFEFYLVDRHEDESTLVVGDGFVAILWSPHDGEALGRNDTAQYWATDFLGLRDSYESDSLRRETLEGAGALVALRDGRVVALYENYTP